MEHQYTNALIKETSPYLLQHSHNPVDWHPWSDHALEEAKKNNKLVIISIGYSACHWCHVMEHESFEDTAVAELMNNKFVNIKIDREERPDVDQIYMTAVQLMTGRGGWPLNVITLPDGRPIWGGTYLPKDNWMQTLKGIAEIYEGEPEKVLEYAEKLHQGILQAELVKINKEEPLFNSSDAQTIYDNWAPRFDLAEGGANKAPKFPMPNNWQYMLHYGKLSGNQKAIEQVTHTLDKMAYGGIYDQVGGGFARYSTDVIWKAPHFEKMLYDNAQLVSLYCDAYRYNQSQLYKDIVAETLGWVSREMTGPDGEFYSALDADSEGEEGKFYVWKKEELQAIIPPDEWEAFSSYYDLDKGLWEHGNIILMRSDASVQGQAQKWNEALLKERENRVRPGLDDKSLTSWNALMLHAYLEAYTTFGEKDYLKVAFANADFILKNQLKKDGSLYHSYKKGESKINGLLEDYALSIQAFLKLFEVTGDEDYLSQAKEWAGYVKAHFEEKESQLFYTRNLKEPQLIAKSLQTSDNVIPASNSIMANSLFLLSHYLDEPEYRAQAENMMNHIKASMLQYGEGYSNWGQLLLKLTYPYYEVAIAGKEAQGQYLKFRKGFHPNLLFIHSEKDSELPLLENRYVKGSTKIYVCQSKVCQLPIEKVDEALKLINQP